MLLALLVVATQDGLRRHRTTVVRLRRRGLGSPLKRKGDNGVSDSDSCDKREFKKVAEYVTEAPCGREARARVSTPVRTLLREHSRPRPP